jgi:hypothetical protein
LKASNAIKQEPALPVERTPDERDQKLATAPPAYALATLQNDSVFEAPLALSKASQAMVQTANAFVGEMARRPYTQPFIQTLRKKATRLLGTEITARKFEGFWNKAIAPGMLFYDIAQVPKTIASALAAVQKAQLTQDAGDSADARRSVTIASKSTLSVTRELTTLALNKAKVDALSRAIKIDVARLAKTNPKAAQRMGSTMARKAIISRVMTSGKPVARVLKTTAKVTERFGMKGMAKLGGRFVPLANVGIAALDAANATSVQLDPRKSPWQKAAAWLTAAGSGVAATNIPIASQIGSIVSIVGDIGQEVLPNES